MRVYISDIEQNIKNYPRLKGLLVYACLYSADDDRLIISSTLDYIANAIAEREYVLVRVDGGEVKKS